MVKRYRPQLHHLAVHVAAQPPGEMSRRARLGGLAKAQKWKLNPPPPKLCTFVENGVPCTRGHKGFGLCKMHLNRKKADAERRGVPFEEGSCLRMLAQNKGTFCKEPGCTNMATSVGWCRKHYHLNLRRRDPTHKEIKHSYGAPQRFLKDVIFNCKSDDCLWWPFGDRARMVFNGKKRDVPRIICEHLYGPAPTTKHQASHTCNHGHLG